MSFAAYMLVKHIKKKLAARRSRDEASTSGSSSSTSSPDSSTAVDSGAGAATEDDAIDPDSPLFFPFSTVAAATGGFSADNKLGEGGFGPVYKGRLPDGREIAVKRLSRSSGQGAAQFRAEVQVISRLRHRNLVALLGYSVSGEERLLVYELLRNGSLADILFSGDEEQRRRLGWSRRRSIAEEVARGLLYLHRDCPVKIIHRDLKPSNVLLDDSFIPKISDFGMARMFAGAGAAEDTTSIIVGTFGYMSPEYAMWGRFSDKSDVFSFGMLVLEIVSGMRSSSFVDVDGTSLSLLGHAWSLWKAGAAEKLLDPAIAGGGGDVARLVHVGLLCVQGHPAERPTMGLVMSMLTSDAGGLPEPKRAAFFGVDDTSSAPSSIVIDLPTEFWKFDSK